MCQDNSFQNCGAFAGQVPIAKLPSDHDPMQVAIEKSQPLLRHKVWIPSLLLYQVLIQFIIENKIHSILLLRFNPGTVFVLYWGWESHKSHPICREDNLKSHQSTWLLSKIQCVISSKKKKKNHTLRGNYSVWNGIEWKKGLFDLCSSMLVQLLA